MGRLKSDFLINKPQGNCPWTRQFTLACKKNRKGTLRRSPCPPGRKSIRISWYFKYATGIKTCIALLSRMEKTSRYSIILLVNHQITHPKLQFVLIISYTILYRKALRVAVLRAFVLPYGFLSFSLAVFIVCHTPGKVPSRFSHSFQGIKREFQSPFVLLVLFLRDPPLFHLKHHIRHIHRGLPM